MIKTKVISGLINPTGIDTIDMNDTTFLLPTASDKKCRTISRIKNVEQYQELKKKKSFFTNTFTYLFSFIKFTKSVFIYFNNTVNFELL